MKFNKILTLALSITMIFSATAGSVSASDKNLEPETRTETNKIVSSDGKDIGYVTVETTIEYKNLEEGLQFTVTKDSDYTLNPEFANIKEYNDTFSDGITSNTYLITKDQKIYTEGKLLIDPSSPPSMSLFSDTGGIPAITHYYSDSSMRRYTFHSYSDIEVAWTMDIKPTGSHINGIVSDTSRMFNRAKSAVDSFAVNYNQYNRNVKAVMVFTGTAALTWWLLIGLVGSGAGIAYEAGQAVDAYNAAKSDVNKAYNYINQF